MSFELHEQISQGNNIELGNLYKTKGLVIGPMESARQEGSSIREYVSEKLSPLGITIWNHYENPIIGHDEGDEEVFENLVKWREAGMYEEIEKYKYIRKDDLSLVDKADFVIMHYNKDKLSCGTWEEVFHANKIKKPIMVFSDQGVKSLPMWMFWTLPHRYFYNSIDEVLMEIMKINSGIKPMDSDRWKLLKMEYR
jgi:hypothetical protein